MEKQKVLGDGVVTGYGLVDGRKVFVFAQDFTVFGGSLSRRLRAEDLQGDGPRDEGRRARHRAQRLGRRAHPGGRRVARRLRRHLPAQHARVSGVVPQISAIMGPCAGGAVYSPAITDFILMVEGTSYMFITGPEVIKTVTHEEVTKEDARRRARRTRRRAASATSPRPTTARASRRCASCSRSCPSNNPRTRRSSPTQIRRSREVPELDTMVPRRVEQAVRHQGRRSAPWSTTATSSRSHERYAPNIVVGFARIGGRADRRRRQPAAGPRRRASTSTPSMKAARFVRFCDCFNIPLVTFVDVPGFLPGHRSGVRRHHQARREAALRVRRGHGARRSPSSRARRTAARTTSWRRSTSAPTSTSRSRPPRSRSWAPTARSTSSTATRSTRPPTRREPRAQFVADYREKFANPYKAAELGFIDEVIYPRMLRRRLAQALEMLKDKRQTNPPKKHGNIPL